MSWEHMDISMAPRAGRIDEFRNEAARDRRVLHLIRDKRSRRARAIRSRFAEGLAALAGRIAPSEDPVRVAAAD